METYNSCHVGCNKFDITVKTYECCKWCLCILLGTPLRRRADTAANATIFTLQNTLEYAGNRKICSIVAKNMRFCKYYCI